ncbi:MAG: hypothetical protein ACFFC7_35020 [Candidatus Hermodarchaeota archaeon]
MQWTSVTLVLLAIGCVSAALTILFAVWTEYVRAYKNAWDLRLNFFGFVFAIVALTALLSSYIIINKKF